MSAFEPQPPVTELTRPFWEGGLVGELRLQRCTGCGHLRYPISAICPRCLSSQAAWKAVSGLGAVLSYTVFHNAYHDSWKDRLPYVVALIELDEGPVLVSNVIGITPAEVRVGMRVTAAFPHRSPSAALPQFVAAGKTVSSRASR